MNAVEKAILDSFKQNVGARLPLHRMVLFGSRARGEATAGSDMDVLVVLEDPVTADDMDVVSECAWEAGFAQGIVVVPVTVSRRQWEEGPERHSLLARAIELEGIAG